MKRASRDSEVTIVPMGCYHDCGGRCVLKAHIKDGKIIRFETDNGEEPQIRACLRGRAYRKGFIRQTVCLTALAYGLGTCIMGQTML